MSLCRTVLLFVLLVEPSPSPEGGGVQSSAAQRLEFAKRAAQGYQFRSHDAASRKVTLLPNPLLRWNNTIVREDDGMLFLWTQRDNGRPVAAAQFFLADGIWHHEFQSVIAETIEARDSRGDWLWGPAQPDLHWQALNSVSEVGDSAAQRLRQMKLLAGQFTAAVDQDAAFESSEQLRLLTTPLYRYTSSDEGIIDGAVFAFVQGTNPEILLVVEALDAGASRRTWRHGFARMSCFNLRVYRDGKTVWSKERASVPTADRTSPYFFRWSVEKDRSSGLIAPSADSDSRS